MSAILFRFHSDKWYQVAGTASLLYEENQYQLLPRFTPDCIDFCNENVNVIEFVPYDVNAHILNLMGYVK